MFKLMKPAHPLSRVPYASIVYCRINTLVICYNQTYISHVASLLRTYPIALSPCSLRRCPYSFFLFSSRVEKSIVFSPSIIFITMFTLSPHGSLCFICYLRSLGSWHNISIVMQTIAVIAIAV